MAGLGYKTWVEIKSENIIHNINQFKKLIGPRVMLMSVIKSNAYGHGLVEIGKIAAKNGVDWLGVDSLDEALKIREARINLPILVLGYTLNSRLKEAMDNDISMIIYNDETVEAMSTIKTNNKNFKVHIKLETGTSRQGVLKEKLSSLIEKINNAGNIEIQGISTHYANIEDTTDHSYAQKQLSAYSKIVDNIKGHKNIKIKHTACSAATILYPETYFDMVRVGISLYGLWSSKETLALAKSNGGSKKDFKKNKLSEFSLKPALTWKSIVAQIKNIKSGTPVSYGLTEKVNKDTRVAIIPVGYWDGYDRKLSSIGNVLIKGIRCKIIGRVCMNMIVVDACSVSNLKVEEEIVLLGKQGEEEITAEEVAQKTDTINYEVVTRINPTIPRIVK